MRTRILVGTRASQLALAQTNQVIEEMRLAVSGLKCNVISIRTKGDKMHQLGTSVEGKGVFTKELEEALIEGRIDIAIHSMKDLTIDSSTGITIGAVPKRADPHDVLISREKKRLAQLPPGSRIGTSSPRRKSQLLAARGDLEVVDIHGNVETRLRKLASGAYDAIVVAAAGLARLQLRGSATEVLPTNLMLPAVGQGALAIQSRNGDQEIIDLIAKIDDPQTRRETDAERAFAKKVGGNCKTPIAAYARAESTKLTIEGMIASPNGRMLVRGRVTSDNRKSAQIGEELARSLLDKGAEALLE